MARAPPSGRRAPDGARIPDWLLAPEFRGGRLIPTREIPTGNSPKLEIFRAPVGEEEFLARWRETFDAGSKFLREVSLRRLEPSRTVAFSRGEVLVDDLHSRARIPLLRDRPRRLAEIFAVDEGALARALSIAGDPEPEISHARIAAYLAVDATPDNAFAAIATPDGYRRLMEGVADVSGEGWNFRFSPPGTTGAGFQERVAPNSSGRALEVTRHYADGRTAPFSLRVDARDGETWLVREAVLSGPREDLLSNDSARGRLAGALAADLLGWAVMLR